MKLWELTKVLLREFSEIFRIFLIVSMDEKSFRFFFLSGFSFTDINDSQDSRGREGTICYSTLTLPPAHEHSDIYLQLYT